MPCAQILAGFAKQAQKEDNKGDEVDTMHRSVVLIEKLERMIETAHGELRRIDEGETEKRRMKRNQIATLEKTLLKTYKSLNEED